MSASNDWLVRLKSLGGSVDDLQRFAWEASETIGGSSQEYSSSYLWLSGSDPTKGVLMKNPEKRTKILIEFCSMLMMQYYTYF